MNLFCEHPVVIQSHDLRMNVLKYRNYTIKGVYHHMSVLEYNRACYSFPWSIFSVKRNNIELSDIPNSYVLTPDGECIPLYLAVPCGKCVLCTEKNRTQWSFRVALESQCYNWRPLFITLTYAPLFLPKDGVQRRDLQLFFKRLRRLFETRYPEDKERVSYLRYFAVSEYGHEYKRAHYHIILWNFPYLELQSDFYALFRDAWGKGRVEVQRVKNAAGKYCCKYMRKDDYIPEGANKPFMLSSRGSKKYPLGGIGYPWLLNNFDYLLEHPELSDIVCADKFDSRRVHRGGICPYFKRKLYPTLSVMLGPKVSKLLKELDYNIMHLVRLSATNRQPCGLWRPERCPEIMKVLEKFPFFELHYPHISYSYKIEKTFNKMHTFKQSVNELDRICKELLQSPFDWQEYLSVQSRKVVFQLSCAEKFSNQPDYDIDFEVSRIVKKREEYRNMEKL